MLYAKDCWLVVADARRAMILQNDGDDCYPNFRIIKGYEQHVFTDRRDDDEPMHKEQFLRGIAAYLENDCVLGSFTSLIVAAGPAVLSEFRRAMSPRLKQFVIAEMQEDLINAPMADIQRKARQAQQPIARDETLAPA